MAYSQAQWDQVKHWFEIGVPLSEIAKKTDVKDKGTISRKATAEGWIKGKNATVVKKEVEARQALSEVEEEKATKNATEQAVINAAVAEQLQTSIFFKSAHMLAAKTAVMKLEQDGVAASYQDVKAAANTITAAQDGVMGKAPAVAVQVNNNGSTEPSSIGVVANRADRMKAVRALLESRL